MPISASSPFDRKAQWWQLGIWWGKEPHGGYRARGEAAIQHREDSKRAMDSERGHEQWWEPGPLLREPSLGVTHTRPFLTHSLV